MSAFWPRQYCLEVGVVCRTSPPFALTCCPDERLLWFSLCHSPQVPVKKHVERSTAPGSLPFCRSRGRLTSRSRGLGVASDAGERTPARRPPRLASMALELHIILSDLRR